MNVATKTDKMLSRKEGNVGYLIFNNPPPTSPATPHCGARDC